MVCTKVFLPHFKCLLQAHICPLNKDHPIGFDCLSDEQTLHILMFMDPDSLMNFSRFPLIYIKSISINGPSSFYVCLNLESIFDRVSTRMQQLGCDPNVWKQMFKKIWEHIYEEDVTKDFNRVDPEVIKVIKVKDPGFFNEETLKRMVDFCNDASLSKEMRSEVVKVVAGMIEFPGPANFDCDSFESFDPEDPEIMIRLTIQGWGHPETLEVDGNRLEELTNVEENLRVRATIVAIEAYSGAIEDIQKIKLISDRLTHNPGELTPLDLDVADLRLVDGDDRDVIDAHVYLLLGANIKEWHIGDLRLDGNKDTWAALASTAATRHIFTLRIFSDDGATWLGEVNQEDISKVWEATYDLVFEGGVAFHGGRLNNTEADWQAMMQFLGRDLE